MNDCLLSVVVPVYNVERYLSRCLESLSKQTLSNWEVIVVNDGSFDNSQEIIERYAQNYPELFRCLVIENGGLGNARNVGMNYAKGKYIAFLDSDDYLAKTTIYQEMCALAERENADLVVADLCYVWENQQKEDLRESGLYPANLPADKALFLSPLFSWNKLYRRDLWQQLSLRFPVNLWYEDLPVVLMYATSCQKIAYYPQVIIHYLQRDSSILGTSYSPKMADIFTIFEGILNDFRQRGLFEKYSLELEYLMIEHFLVYGAFRFLRTSKYKELMKRAFCFVSKEFPNYRYNPYVLRFPLKFRLFFYSNNRLTMHFWHRYLIKKEKLS